MIWALHFSLAPTLFEPAETPGVVSPFMSGALRGREAENQMNETA